ncbi:MAG: hypothetical protein J1E96_05175 [Ruminococcus sp.]|nr:hypothetical protein [Ruminococcus sp.]
MKKSQELSRKTWKMLAKNLIILAVLGVVAFVGVMSWFTQSTKAEADGISVKTEVSDGLEYYIVAPSDSDQYSAINKKLEDKGESWHRNSLTFDFKQSEFKFMEDLFLCEVTSDGKTFMIPKLLQYGEIAYVDTSTDFENADANENYMSFDIYFRTKSKYDVMMKSDSSIVPTGEIDPNTEDGVKNAAIGAVRLATLNGSNRQLLWIPGPCVWFDGLANNKEGKLMTQVPATEDFGKGSVYHIEGTDTLQYTGGNTSTHEYYNDSKMRDTIRSNGTNVIASTAGDYKLGKDVSMITLDKEDSVNGYYYNYARINLWIEGEDAEARLKCVGGKFNMTLKFGLKGINED